MPETNYSIKKIAEIVHGNLLGEGDAHGYITSLLTDSRRLHHPHNTLFICLRTDRNDGHRYITELEEKGVRYFLVQKDYDPESPTTNPASRIPPPGSSLFIQVSNTLHALQQLAAFHRHGFHYPVVGITGSNGKTVVKEWLYQLLSPGLKVVKSPKSYNSQTGVPLSVWHMKEEDQLGIFEAGISQPGEMERLAPIIDPTIGIFTNIGPSHDAGFKDRSEKIAEKLKLFSHAEILIYRSQYEGITAELDKLPVSRKPKSIFTWGDLETDSMRILSVHKEGGMASVRLAIDGHEEDLDIPFTDEASIENALHCRATLEVLSKIRDLGSGIRDSKAGIAHLTPVAMRLELKEGINGCSIINDSYNSDVHSLRIAIDLLNQQQQHPRRTLILSDILQSGLDEGTLYGQVAAIVRGATIDRFIGIGPNLEQVQSLFPENGEFYATTESFLRDCPLSSFHDETILLKGARKFGFEEISKALQYQAHETVLEINLEALLHNLNHFRDQLNPGVKTMAMVKAFSYGSGSFEVANLLQVHQVDYLAVAYPDEGVALRKAGIVVPIMVMSPEKESLETLLQHDLEPEIYSFRLLELLENAIQKQGISHPKVRFHVKLDTGMHRLGFCLDQIAQLRNKIHNHPQLQIASVFTHLAASDDPAQDDFTHQQISRFQQMADILLRDEPTAVLRHVLNSAGITRFPEYQFDMVRLGIGMYGIGATGHAQKNLQEVLKLKSIITQIKHIGKGESIGYDRQGKAQRESWIATVPVGYADGYDRRLGNGKGSMYIKGKRVPTIGNICMDLCMLDVTDLVETGNEISEGEEVIVFGGPFPVSQLAGALNTIPYEVMTSVSRRVKRIYLYE